MFQNHEIIKITDSNTFLSSVAIYIVLAVLSICYIKKNNNCAFMNQSISSQVRGIAILFVVIGHIGIHVLDTKENWLVMGDYGVAIFFLLSGFGLTRSYAEKKIVIRAFIIRRLSRVMIPYFLATCIILILDYNLLDRVYSINTILLTFCGINFSNIAKHIDYVRWYITVLIIWYFFFSVYWNSFSRGTLITVFLVTGFILTVLDYYLLHLGYAYISFPCGVMLGVIFDDLILFLHKFTHRVLLMFSVIGLILPYLFAEYLFPQIMKVSPYISIVFMKEFLWICFTVSLFLLFYSIPSCTSFFLELIGKYSFEIFLFHGVFMVKYDFVLYKGPLYLTFWPYFLFILFISIIMQKIMAFTKAQNYITP